MEVIQVFTANERDPKTLPKIGRGGTTDMVQDNVSKNVPSTCLTTHTSPQHYNTCCVAAQGGGGCRLRSTERGARAGRGRFSLTGRFSPIRVLHFPKFILIFCLSHFHDVVIPKRSRPCSHDGCTGDETRRNHSLGMCSLVSSSNMMCFFVEPQAYYNPNPNARYIQGPRQMGRCQSSTGSM